MGRRWDIGIPFLRFGSTDHEMNGSAKEKMHRRWERRPTESPNGVGHRSFFARFGSHGSVLQGTLFGFRIHFKDRDGRADTFPSFPLRFYLGSIPLGLGRPSRLPFLLFSDRKEGERTDRGTKRHRRSKDARWRRPHSTWWDAHTCAPSEDRMGQKEGRSCVRSTWMQSTPKWHWRIRQVRGNEQPRKTKKRKHDAKAMHHNHEHGNRNQGNVVERR